MIDHIHTVNQLKENCAEYQKSLCLTFVDCEKAFDSVESKAILTSLERQGIDKGYIDALAEIQNGASTLANVILIRKAARQCNTISPKLFTATLEDLFRNFDWSNRGVSINGNKLSNQRFANDVTIIAQDIKELEISQ